MLKKLIYSILCLGTVVSCCNEHDENAGIIQSDYTIEGTNSFEGMTYNIDIDCLITPDTACVRNDSVYKALFKIDTTSRCRNAILPKIDFNTYSLLVNRKNTVGRVFFHRNVTVDSINKTVTYIVSETYCHCIDVCHSNESNIVIVPAISKAYKVIYK